MEEEVAVLQQALFQAIEENQYTVLEDLLRDYELDLNLRNMHGELPLQFACGLGMQQLASLLIVNGAQVNNPDSNGDTALHWASRAGHTTLVRWLYEQGASVDLHNKSGETAVHLAARHAYEETVRQLCKCGANVDICDEHHESALHIAAWHGLPRVLHVLGEVGARMNTQNREQETALHCAASRGHYHCVRLLLRQDANPNLQDKNGATPLHLALRRKHLHIGLLLLKRADIRVDLLDAHGDNGLHVAVRTGYQPAVLLACIRLNQITQPGATGADASLRNWVDRKNRTGDTPLHLAVARLDAENVRILCAMGADTSCRGADGRSAIEHAQRELDACRINKNQEISRSTLVERIYSILTTCSQHRFRCALLAQLRPSSYDTNSGRKCILLPYNISKMIDNSIDSDHKSNNLLSHSSTTFLCANCGATLLHPKNSSGCCNAPGDAGCVAEDRLACCNRSATFVHWSQSPKEHAGLECTCIQACIASEPREWRLSSSVQRLKITLLGDAEVGKSSLLESLCAGYLSSWLRKTSKQSANKSTNDFINEFQNSLPNANELESTFRPFTCAKRKCSGNICSSYSACSYSMQPSAPVQVCQLQVPSVGECIAWQFNNTRCSLQLTDRLLDSNSFILVLIKASDDVDQRLAQAEFWLSVIVNVHHAKSPLRTRGASYIRPRIQMVFTHIDKLRNSNAESNLLSQYTTIKNRFDHLLDLEASPLLLDATQGHSVSIKQLKSRLLEEKQRQLLECGPMCPLLELSAKHVALLRSSSSGSPLITEAQFVSYLQTNVNLLASRSQIHQICDQLERLGELHILRGTDGGGDLLLLDLCWVSDHILQILLVPQRANTFLCSSDECSEKCTLNSDHRKVTSVEVVSCSSDLHTSQTTDTLSSVDERASSTSCNLVSLDELQSLLPTTDALDLLILLQNLELCASSDGDFEYLFPTNLPLFNCGGRDSCCALTGKIGTTRESLSSSVTSTTATITSSSPHIANKLTNNALASTQILSYSSPSTRETQASASCLLSSLSHCASSTSGYVSGTSECSVNTWSDYQLACLIVPLPRLPNISFGSHILSPCVLFNRLQVLLERLQQEANVLPRDQVHVQHFSGLIRLRVPGAQIIVRPSQISTSLASPLLYTEHAMLIHVLASSSVQLENVYLLYELLCQWFELQLQKIWPGIHTCRRPLSVLALRRGNPRPHAFEAILVKEAFQKHGYQGSVSYEGGEQEKLNALLLGNLNVYFKDEQLNFTRSLEQQLADAISLLYCPGISLRSAKYNAGFLKNLDELDGNKKSSHISEDVEINQNFSQQTEQDKHLIEEGDDELFLPAEEGDEPENNSISTESSLRFVYWYNMHICDMPRSVLAQLCDLMDPPHEMGQDWCLLGVKLSLTDKLPLLDARNKEVSPCWRLLEECAKSTSYTVGRLCEVLKGLGRQDAYDLLISSGPAVQLLPIKSHTFRTLS